MFNLFVGGVGSGKSFALCCWAIRRALANPNAVGALLGRTSIDLQTVLLPCLFDRLQDCQDQTGVCLIRAYDKGNAKLTLINGAVIFFRPYNRIAKLRGLTLTWACADEIAFAEAPEDEVFSVLAGRLRGKGPVPGLAFATSPNGAKGVVGMFVAAQRHYALAKQSGDLEATRRWRQWHVVTAKSFDNPYLPDHFFDSLRSMSKRRFEQECNGRVLAPLNTVLTLEPRHFVDWDWRQHKNLPWILGVDWGGQSGHVAIMVQLDRTTDPKNPRYVVADELIGDDLPRAKFQKLLSDWVSSKGQDPIFAGVDRACPGENQILQTRLRNTSIRWLHSRDQQRVTSGVEHLRDLLDVMTGEPKLVFSRSLATVATSVTSPIVHALRNYSFHLDSNGQPTGIPNKSGGFDHAPDALRYAVFGAKEFPPARL